MVDQTQMSISSKQDLLCNSCLLLLWLFTSLGPREQNLTLIYCLFLLALIRVLSINYLRAEGFRDELYFPAETEIGESLMLFIIIPSTL